MSEIDIIKGVSTLKTLAVNIGSLIEHAEMQQVADPLFRAYIEEMNKGCGVLTDIFERAFTDMIADKERLDDDGK